MMFLLVHQHGLLTLPQVHKSSPSLWCPRHQGLCEARLAYGPQADLEAYSRCVVTRTWKSNSFDIRLNLVCLTAERAALADCPNVLPYSQALATERAGYLIRQWLASNLYDRIR